MAAKLDGNRSRRAVRDMIDDIDYVSKLSEAEKEWLEIFVAAVAGNDDNAQAALSPTPDKFRQLYLAISREHNARRRDLMGVYSKAPYVEQAAPGFENDEWTIEAMSHVRSEFFKHYRCSRCLAPADKCACPRRQRNKPYGIEDYTPMEESEDTMIAAIDVKRRIQAYDLLPYGTNPQGLRSGQPVQICLPMHLFKDAWGILLGQRQDGKWLVEVKSRRGLRDRDGSAPETITVWVAGEGLRRYRPTLVK
jgi:hypothetical protein